MPKIVDKLSQILYQLPLLWSQIFPLCQCVLSNVRAVIEFLTAGKVWASEIHRHLKAIYDDETIERSTVSSKISCIGNCPSEY